QAEDGIRDLIVTGVQTCALPISTFAWLRSSCAWNLTERRITFLYRGCARADSTLTTIVLSIADETTMPRRSCWRPRSPSGFGSQIGRASCRGRVEMRVGGGWLRE